MTNEQKLLQLRTRRNILIARGPQNARIVAKIDRQIRRLAKGE